MKNIEGVKAGLMKATGRAGLKIRKYSPELLVGVGVIGVVAGAVMACKATLHVEEVLGEHQEKMDKIKEVWEDEKFSEEEYSEADMQKDILVTRVQTSVNFVQLYGPSVLVGIGGLVAILSAHGIMRKRNAALVAAYTALDSIFKEYRQRVVSELGEEADMRFKTGITKTKVELIDENGKKYKDELEVVTDDGTVYSQYARFFDESCQEWTKSPEHNLTFLTQMQSWMNQVLKTQGHVFLNEVYDALGMQRSKAGACVGWVYDSENGDGFIDFGIHDVHKPGSRDFVNGFERTLLCDFNVDGIILDLI